MNHSEYIICAKDVTYTYEGCEKPSLYQLSVNIPKGKKIAVMGANGSGKSTFFLCCNGILRPQKGEIVVEGEPIRYRRKDLLAVRQKVGIVFQDPDSQLFASDVKQEISFGILNTGATKEQAEKAVNEVMATLRITSFADQPTHALSGGQKKQVSIADVLVMEPKLVILDEPAAALDPYHEQLTNQVIDQMTEKGITVMVATHNVDYAYQWADEVILFWKGSILMQGEPQQVFADKRALELTHLNQPMVLEIYERLRKHKLLQLTSELPKTLDELEKGLVQSKTECKREQETTSLSKTQPQEKKSAILVVSFGTSHEDTRIKTIDAIETEIRDTYQNHSIYRAWTSDMIRNKIRERDHLIVDSVKEAMERMKQDKITEVVVQPTHVINGVENDKMIKEASLYRKDFEKISFGSPLLTTELDHRVLIEAVVNEFHELEEKEVLVLMGHGTTHYANAVYAALDYEFKDRGYSNIFLGTVEAYPSFDSILHLVEDYGAKKIVLAPFMIVAGDHAKNDLSGSDENSWYRRFTKAGFEVSCVLKGLGEYKKVRELFLSHIEEAF